MYICFQCSSRYPIRVDFCSQCLDSGTVIIEPQRPLSNALQSLKVMSARDLAKAEWTTLENKRYPELVIGRGALVGVYGEPGAGKSTWMAKYLDGVGKPVVYISLEEEHGPTMTMRLSRLGIKSPDFTVVGRGTVDEHAAVCREMKAEIAAIDSVGFSTMNAQQLRPFMQAAGLKAMVFAMQVTKEGKAAGSNEFKHEADVVVHVAHYAWELEKSRYQDIAAGGGV